MAGFYILCFVFFANISICSGRYCRASYLTVTKYTKYGTWGWKWGSRIEYKKVTRTRQVCCTGWDGSGCNNAVCGQQGYSRRCNRNEGRVVLPNGQVITSSGGRCTSPGVCTGCNTGYYSSFGLKFTDAFCRMCKQIDHCNIPHCTTIENTWCERCSGETNRESPGTNAYIGDSPHLKRCIEACSWRQGRRCYPGVCGDNYHFSNCICADGFEGEDNDCKIVSRDNKPMIYKQSLTLRGDGDTDVKFIDFSNAATDKVWTNELSWSNISIEASATFIPNYTAATVTKPYIIDESTVIGVKELTFEAVFIRNQAAYQWKETKVCHYKTVCYITYVGVRIQDRDWIPGNYFKHDDAIEFTVTAKNGGVVRFKNFETSRESSYSIIGVQKTNTMVLGFDTHPPKHCLELEGSCTTDALITPDFIKNAAFSVSWGDWYDDASGLDIFEFDVYKLVNIDRSLVQKTRIYRKTVSALSKTDSTKLHLTDIGPHAVEIIAIDKAGNQKMARRILMFDNSSKVDIQGRRSIVEESNELGWITDFKSHISINWYGRFININHANNHWLDEVAPSGTVSRDLDDTDGRSERTISAVHNINGIVRVEVAYTVTLNGNVREKEFVVVPLDYFHDQRFIVNEDFIDGKRIDFKIWAYDMMDEYNQDNVTVFIDLSPPVIENIWLTNGDFLNISVHSVTELNKLTFEWEVHDVHSGIQEVFWRIYDNFTQQEVEHGRSYASPQSEMTLEQCVSFYTTYPRGPNCYCSPFNGCFHKHFQSQPVITTTGADGIHSGLEKGKHDRDYFIEVKAVNNAGLSTTRFHKITIDTSPPHEGFVHDGKSGQPEVDFQQGLQISAHWDGFFDKESSVWFYLFAFGPECFQKNDLDIHSKDNSEVHRTYSTAAMYTALNPGKYHVTVVAYNHALDGSKPVCSDGVTVDSTPATVSEIVLKDSVIASGLIRDDETDQVFFVAGNREIEEIDHPSQICFEKATQVPSAKIKAFPHKRHINGTKLSLPALVCENAYGIHESLMMFTKSDAQLQISWNVSYGASGVYDYEVGLSSQDSTLPDILKYGSSHHHTFITILHPYIVEGETFFVLIKTTTNSGITDTKTIGPFAVIKSPPAFQGLLTVRKEMFEGSLFLIVEWTQDDFVDPVDPHPLVFQVSVGTSTEGQDILPFAALSYGGSCQYTLPPKCTAINVQNLPWLFHGKQIYLLTIKASNQAGLFVSTTITYKHDIELPSRGLVHDVEISTTTEFMDIDDIDFQSNNDTLAVRWDGFDHPFEDIAYSVCLSEKDSNDYITCNHVDSKSSHVFRNVNLVPYQTYYQTVIAVTGAGNTTVTSDGVTVVLENDHISGVIIDDGPRCKLSDTRNDINMVIHHHIGDKRPRCQNDLEYQSSTNRLEAHWVIPEEKRHVLKDVYWTVEEKAPIADFWTAVGPYVHIMSVDHLYQTDLILMPGRKYRISLKFCPERYCFMPLQSDGVTVIPNPPSTGHIDVIETEPFKLTVEMTPFRDSDIEDEGEQLRVMDHYEWAFTDSHDGGRLIGKWKRIDITDHAENKIKFEIELQSNISFATCWKVSVRGYTKAGLSSLVYSEIRNCSDIQQERPNIVIDATGELSLLSQDNHHGQGVYLKENTKWLADDVDYTPYSNIFSAVWPTLRHRNYTWAILRINPDDALTFDKPSEQLYLEDPCSHPNALKCGHTRFEFVNAVFAEHPLEHGHRYMVCIHASKTAIAHAFWTQQLDYVNTCSDGMTVDLTPPTTADVWIGLDTGHRFQTSTSDMTVYWESFMDVEEYGFAVHSSGIASYDVAIGTSAGGTDVVSFTSVGLMNHHTFHHLTLQGGHTYFATVKAHDFTNQTSQSVSSGVKVDITPPTRTGKSISVVGRHIKSTSLISADWNGAFEDPESGISHYEWCVGTHAGYNDVMDYIISDEEFGQTPAGKPLSLTEGHLYFITIKAYNNAGLFSLQSSWAISVDVSGPIPGHIFDGAFLNGSVNDMDYTTNSSVIKTHWTYFHDPHTIVNEYYVSIGTCKTCADILTRNPVGVVNSFTVDNQHLAEGVTHFVIVTACNTAELCTSASSDGFIVDTTPPVPGHVLDGIHGKDIRYQSSRQAVGCRWYGFYDSQSGISHYVWRLGLSKGADDILPSQNVHNSQEGFYPDYLGLTKMLLPANTPIFCTVRAYNKAGMFTEISSNGFIIDDTAPIFSVPLTQSTIGRITNGTSVLRSVLKVHWQVEDPESYIEAQYLSISTHVGGDFNSSSTLIPGIVRDFTFTDLDLHDGSYYDVKLVTCNGGKLCQQSILYNILVDSTPPTPGVFAINTDHAAALNRQPEGWMTWNALQVKLAWLGFEDLHSGIQFYSVNIGSHFMGDDLNQVPGNPYIIQHDVNGTIYEDGMVQSYAMLTQPLLKYPTIYVSIAATNKVGLTSSLLNSQFDLLYGGIMSLVRRCDSQTCLGHCVCAPNQQLCHSEDTSCVNHSIGTYAPVIVNDYIDLRFPTGAPLVSFTPINTMLAGRWSVQETTSNIPQWYEWSVGETSYEMPVGIYNQAKEKIWHEVGTRTYWVVTFAKGRELLPNAKYSFFVRAWYSNMVFVIYKSPGVIINPFPPKATVIRGRRVKEVSSGHSTDIDFFSKTSFMGADWTESFLNKDGSLAKYHLYLSTYPGGHDAHVLSTDLLPLVTSYNLTGLHFDDYTKYYTVVQAFTHAGLHTTEVSDGFMIDTSPPTVGVVHYGKVSADIHATSSVNSAKLFWYGFSDTESGIKHYEYCVSSLHLHGLCDIHPFTSVGIATQAEVLFSQPVDHGTVIIGEVRAYDVVGHVSSVVTSSGVIVDTTPPLRAATLQCDSNLIHDSSFVNTFAVQTNSVIAELTCLKPMSNDWIISEDSCISLIAYEQQGLNDENILILKGSLSQELNNICVGRYFVTFFTSTAIWDTLHKWSTEGFVEINGERRIFLMYTKANGHEFAWQKHSLWYQIDDNTAPVTFAIGTANNHQVLALKDISLQKCDLDVDTNDNSTGHVKVHTAFVHDWSSIYAEWSFLDPESRIVEYLWAIGTIQDVTQLQSFISVGRQTFAITNSLKFVHNTVVYVTVVAVNGAGLRTVSYSDPVVIDLTPPVFHHIYDGMETDTDIDFQKDLRIDVNWFASDPESSLQKCYWTLGLFEGDTSVKQYTQADYNKSVLSTTLTENPNATLYATVRCTNGVGLTSSSSSDGIRILQHPPMVHDVILNVLTTSATQYPARDHYHGNTSEIRFRWTGFNNDEGIDSCLVSLKGLGTYVSKLVKTNYNGYTYSSFTGLNLVDGVYTVSIVAINKVQMTSETISTTFYLLTNPPQLTASKKPFVTAWYESTSTAHCSWEDAFSSEQPLYYEVTVWLSKGAKDVQWQETINTFIDINIEVDNITPSGVDVKFIVRAIGPSGLFISASTELYIP